MKRKPENLKTRDGTLTSLWRLLRKLVNSDKAKAFEKEFFFFFENIHEGIFHLLSRPGKAADNK